METLPSLPIVKIAGWNSRARLGVRYLASIITGLRFAGLAFLDTRGFRTASGVGPIDNRHDQASVKTSDASLDLTSKAWSLSAGRPRTAPVVTS